MNMPLISVIIPVYNVENYLEKCIESVINQTYENLDIILIDDGSKDNSGVICDDYKNKDSRIRVIHKENGGLSDARNVALDVTKGSYITFIDSDDYVTNDYVEYLYNLIKKTGSDISMCCFQKIYTENEVLVNKTELIEVLKKREAIESYLYQRKFTASAHCKMYKKELFMTIRYPKGYYYEDMAVICNVLDLCEYIAISNQKKYFYIQRNDSIMGERFNNKKMHRIEIAEEIRRFINNNYSDLYSAACARCFLAAVQTIREIPFSTDNVEYYNYAWKVMKSYRIGIIFDSKSKTSHKIIALFSFLGKRVLNIMGNIYTNLFYGILKR